MDTRFRLSMEDALKKSNEIVCRDQALFGFEAALQIAALTTYYQLFDPDKVFAHFSSKEPDMSVLVKEAMRIFQICNAHTDCISHLLSKYELSLPVSPPETPESRFGLPLWIFVENIWQAMQRNEMRVCMTESSKKLYRNFKPEYLIKSMPAMLPAGQNYGGFVKAFLHLHSLIYDNQPNSWHMHATLASGRIFYNNKIYSQEQRLEFFKKLGIENQHCREWSEVFDQAFPQFKDIHKAFGQVA